MYNSIPLEGEHPRLFFSRSDVPALRNKMEHPDCRAAWGRLLAACEQVLAPAPAPLYPRHIRASHMAFAYLMTGRMEFAERSRAMALEIAHRETWSSPGDIRLGWRAGLGTGCAVRETTLSCDWIHDLLTENERTEIRRAVMEKGLEPGLEDIRRNARCAEWYTCNGMCVVNGPAVMASILFEDETDTSEALQLTVCQLRRAVAAHCPDGGYPEGPGYWNYGVRHMLMGVEPLRRLKGIDLFDEPFLHNTGDYVLHHILPWLTACANTADSLSVTHLWPPVAALASYHKRPEWQWLARRLLTHDWGLDGEGLEYSLFYLIYYDPDVPASPPSQDQAVCLFSGLQQLSMRSDWSEDAIHALWLNGPSNCHHNHLHLNHVSISAYGERLLIDMGKYDYSDNEDYRKKTDGHNSLLVDGQGQIITTDESIFCRRIRAGQWGTVFGEFRCLREEAGATIATGAVVNAYAGRLRRFDRTVAFVRKRFFFLHDFVELDTEPSVHLEWHFHAGGEIELEKGQVLFASGKGRLAFVPLCRATVSREINMAPPELDNPDKPVPRLDLKARCGGPTFDLFALLAPYREGEKPESNIWFAEGRVCFEFGQERWHYDPGGGKLAAL